LCIQAARRGAAYAADEVSHRWRESATEEGTMMLLRRGTDSAESLMGKAQLNGAHFVQPRLLLEIEFDLERWERGVQLSESSRRAEASMRNV
jgi:hypothetical protein